MQKKLVRDTLARTKYLVKLWVNSENEGRILIRVTRLGQRWSEGTKFQADNLRRLGLEEFARSVDRLTGGDILSMVDELLDENVLAMRR
jgi:hypothetical protein